MTTRSTLRRSSGHALLATVIGTLVASVGASEKTARADVYVGGHAHIRVGGGGWGYVRTPRVYWRPRWNYYARPAYRIHIGGAIWVGGGYYYRPYAAPPPPAYCDCGPAAVPSYSYYPVAPSATTYAAVQAPPPLPRFGIGLFAGGVDVEGQHASSELGFLARVRLTPGLLIEGDVAKSELEDGTRIDRRLGAGLVWEIGAYNTFAPYLVGEGGVMQAEVGSDWSTTQSFGEIGVGLRWALSRNFHLAADIRAGTRHEVDENGQRADLGVAREIAPPEDEDEQYTRGRISALLYF